MATIGLVIRLLLRSTGFLGRLIGPALERTIVFAFIGLACPPLLCGTGDHPARDAAAGGAAAQRGDHPEHLGQRCGGQRRRLADLCRAADPGGGGRRPGADVGHADARRVGRDRRGLCAARRDAAVKDGEGSSTSPIWLQAALARSSVASKEACWSGAGCSLTFAVNFMPSVQHFAKHLTSAVLMNWKNARRSTLPKPSEICLISENRFAPLPSLPLDCAPGQAADTIVMWGKFCRLQPRTIGLWGYISCRGRVPVMPVTQWGAAPEPALSGARLSMTARPQREMHLCGGSKYRNLGEGSPLLPRIQGIAQVALRSRRGAGRLGWRADLTRTCNEMTRTCNEERPVLVMKKKPQKPVLVMKKSPYL